MSFSLLDLAALVRGHTTDKSQRALASSEAVERQTKPCMSTPAFKTLSYALLRRSCVVISMCVHMAWQRRCVYGV